MSYEIIHENEKGSNARVGILKTRHGSFETPFFMPVATKAVGKFFDGPDLMNVGTQSMIANSFVLYLSPGLDVFKKEHGIDGIHNFMKFKNNIFTDSGGFQMYSDSFLLMTNKDGVKFKDPINGGEVFCTPEKSMDIQLTIGSDVNMCLDDMPRLGAGHSRCLESIKKTTDWARRCKEYHDKYSDGHHVFGISQGGLHDDLRKLAAQKISEIDFPGFALGGLALGEKSSDMFRAVDIALQYLPREKPKYLMGIGVPEQILNALDRGIDMWDSRFPTMNARHGRLFTFSGNIEIKKKVYEHDFTPLEEDCDCYTCKNFTKSYLYHLFRMKEPQANRLLTLHNLRFMHRMLEQAKVAIKEQRFRSFKEEFVEKRKA